MRLANVRLGHATNSSSSHSIVLLKQAARDKAPEHGSLAFGWDFFTRASAQAKAEYFTVAAYRHYRGYGLGKAESATLAQEAFTGTWEAGNPFAVLTTEALADAYIDHESMPTFPRPVGHTDGMGDLWQWIEQHIIADPLAAVLGGNDNSEDEHPLRSEGDLLAVPWEVDGPATRYRADPQGYLATYNPQTGKRVRWCLEDGTPPTRATWPELVDVKITGFCEKACPWCYQDSGPDGKHAEWGVLTSVAYELGRMGVFEVALGGGEPTQHPNFAQLLGVFCGAGVTPNFSTGDLSWVTEPEIAGPVAEHAGAVAYSTANPMDAAEWFSLAEDYGIHRPCLHVILGVVDAPTLRALLDVADAHYSRVVLLAYKGGEGRAPERPPFDPALCWDVIRESKTLKHGRLAVDSFLVPDVPVQLPDANPLTYEVGDGRFSMYYDTVKQQAAAHSHCPASERDDCSPYAIRDWWQKQGGDS